MSGIIVAVAAAAVGTGFAIVSYDKNRKAAHAAQQQKEIANQKAVAAFKARQRGRKVEQVQVNQQATFQQQQRLAAARARRAAVVNAGSAIGAQDTTAFAQAAASPFADAGRSIGFQNQQLGMQEARNVHLSTAASLNMSRQQNLINADSIMQNAAVVDQGLQSANNIIQGAANKVPIQQ